MSLRGSRPAAAAAEAGLAQHRLGPGQVAGVELFVDSPPGPAAGRPGPGGPGRRTPRRWSTWKFVKNACRYRMIHIQAGHHIMIITAADPIPSELRQALDAIDHASRPAPYI